MSRNIKEFTASQVIQYLKERDEEINRLKRGIDKFSMLCDDVEECPICKEWIIHGDYKRGEDIRFCAGCDDRKACINCRETTGFFSPIKLSHNLACNMWFCGDCKNSGYPPTPKPIYNNNAKK